MAGNREEEINFAINLIQQICEGSEIALGVKKYQTGEAKMIIIDAQNGREYDIKTEMVRDLPQ